MKRIMLTACSVVAIVGSTLLTACTGGSSGSQVAQLTPTATNGSSAATTAAGSVRGGGAVTFSDCMRSHGVSRFPDPDGAGELPKVDLQELGMSTSKLQAAQNACQDLLSNDIEASVTECLSTGNCAPALRQQILNEGLEFAQCMRSHGVSNFPDPTTAPDGAPEFDLLAIAGTDWRSTHMDLTLDECQQVYSAGLRVGLRR
jgi:hypothetical protein